MEKLSPSSLMSPYEPCSTCHVHPPSHFPAVGSALKLQGQPQSQLHATRTFPLRRQLSPIFYLSDFSQHWIGGRAPSSQVGLDAVLFPFIRRLREGHVGL